MRGGEGVELQHPTLASSLSVNIAQVYIVKHRLSAQLKKEVALLEKTH